MPTSRRALAPVPTSGSAPTWQEASAAFLRRDLSPGSRRVYGLTLGRVGQEVGLSTPLAGVDARGLVAALHACYPDASPASWNRHVATLRSFASFARRHGWLPDDPVHDPTRALEHRRVPQDHSRALSREDLDRLFALRTATVRDRCLWRFLYESAARAEEVLRLNVEDLDLAARRAVVTRKGGNVEVLHYATGTARLLPKVIDQRASGPLFLSERPVVPSRAPAAGDLDPTTGRARLSYRRAAEVFRTASGGATLHHLRHSALTHLAEQGVPTVLLMAKSGHTSLASLQRYARPGVEAVARLTADYDPARRR